MEKTYTTQRLTLRTMTPENAHQSLNYYERNQRFLEPYEPLRNSSFYTIDHHKRLLRLEEEDMTTLKSLRLWLYQKSDTNFSQPIGNFAFSNIIRGIFQSCHLGYKMDESYIRQGYMSEALTEGIRLIFEDFKLHRIEANIMPSNSPSLALIKKLGFQEEGLAKSYLKINGQWEDHLHMVLLNDQLEN